MKNPQTARRYATALMRSAQSRSAIDSVNGDLTALKRLLDESADFQYITTSPVIPEQRKKLTFTRLFGDTFHPLSMEFLAMLCAKRRESLLAEIIAEFGIQYRDYRGIVQVEVTSVQGLETRQQEALSAQIESLTGRKPEFRFFTDEALIAGFKIKIGDRVFDGTVRRQLEKLREKLTETRTP